jgi:hypothetical protein
MTHLRPPADTVTGRCRVRVRGLVQGVGFRPFVYALAHEHGLTGWVLNDNDGVLAEIQGGGCAGFLDGCLCTSLRRHKICGDQLGGGS